ncbi:glycosyltransferase [Microbacterium sp.]|uniref:glycosyltransferase n=1 Tax=Microbacterium sp. TaxID=51671 RepID=UPI0039E48CB7
MTGLLVHEWIARSGGSENVLEAMADAFPDADIQCLWTDAPERLAGRVLRETWMAGTPLRRSKALALPFTIPTWRRLRADRAYDWMLVSSHLFAHHAKVRNADIPKYVYVHSPARYIWTPEFDQRGANPAIKAVAPLFKRIDRARAREPIAIAANSEFVRKRVQQAWDRDAAVIHPPVDVQRIADTATWSARLNEQERRQLDDLPDVFILGASRFIPYKRLDLVIEAAEAAGVPAVLAGRGPDEDMLRAQAADASVPVRIISSPSDPLLWALYQRAKVLVFPAIEDFGIVPVEAQALGTPIVTGPVGGQLETYIPGKSGIVAESTEPIDLAHAAHRAMTLPEFDGVETTARFSRAVFQDQIQSFVR